jgi:hypothetical protein
VLAQTVDIRRWLREDRRTPFAQRLERDRGIGRALPQRDPVDRVLAWWQQVGRAGGGAGGPRLGERVVAARRLACAALATLGLLLGVGVAGVAFGYDGRYPVNLFTLLGVLVGLPLVLLVFTLLLIPGRVPGLGAFQAVAAGMNLGRWVGAWLDRFLGAELFAPGLLGSGSVSAFSRWQLVVFSQWLALGFFAGALAVALLQVTFTDLAFGWSTTLDMDPALVHGWVAALSSPWAAWLPEAAPDAALVEASRYFRLEEGRMALERVERLGGWWPFVLMTMLVYGALPRLVLMLFGLWRLRRATARLLLEDPEVTALLDRVDAPLVALGGNDEEETLAAERGELPAPREPVSAEGLMLMIWNGALTQERARDWLAANLGVDSRAVVETGILQSEDEQRRRVEQARRDLNGRVRRVVLVTKGWEPPLLEFVDFLGLLREELGGDCSVTVVPVDVAGTAVRAAERSVWSHALARVRDPRLYVLEAST